MVTHLGTWDHAVLPAIWHRWTCCSLTPSQADQYSIYLLQRVGRLSWQLWFFIHWDGLPLCRQDVWKTKSVWFSVLR